MDQYSREQGKGYEVNIMILLYPLQVLATNRVLYGYYEYKCLCVQVFM